MDTRTLFAGMPEDLQARLIAAGATDPGSLEAALQQDPQLATDVDAYIDANEEALEQASLSALVKLFAEVRNDQAMAEFLQQVPVEMEDKLIGMIEQVIAGAKAAGDESAVRHYTVRLSSLQLLRQQPNPEPMPPMARALLEFVQASDEGAACQVFARHEALLKSPEARVMLDKQFRADDVATRRHLARRAALLRRLG